jgi:four helix bundle protein
MAAIQSFTDLKAWKESHKLVLMIYAAGKQFPQREQFGLTQQVQRAVVSISSNIAEGFSKTSSKEKTQFYRISLASLTEVQNQILIARDIQYLKIIDFNQIAEQTVLVSKLINGLIKSMKARTP